MVEAIPGMNNITVILRNPESLALDAIERLQRWWEESEALEPESRFIEIPVVTVVQADRIWRWSRRIAG